MFDLKFSEKASIILVVLLIMLIGIPFLVSYQENRPFSVLGKDFGFGGSEIDKNKAEFEKYRKDSENYFLKLQTRLTELEEENKKLKEASRLLAAQEVERARASHNLWFPVDDIEFSGNGQFSSSDKENARGKWTHSESEFSLRLVTAESDEAVFETNLPAPGNRIRIREGQAILVPMSKWDYQILVRSIYDGAIKVRVERRPKI